MIKRKLLQIAAVCMAFFMICFSETAFAGTEYKKNADINFKKVFDLKNDGKYEANPNELMAHNIYSDPVIPNDLNKRNGFLIDFKADFAPKGTYWALCNWSMMTDAIAKKHCIVNGYDAYAGFQNTDSGKKLIMSFWTLDYIDGTSLKQVSITPKIVYPKNKKAGHFDNEGSGVQYFADYDWKDGKWYTMYLNCYTDKKTKYTFVEMWVKELPLGKWKKICCYNTRLKNAYMVGAMSQFMENYDDTYSTSVRSFEYRNIYMRNRKNNKWKHIKKSVLSVDTMWNNKKGTFAFGATKTNLWGITCGYGRDQAKPDEYIVSSVIVYPTAKP